MMCVKEHEMEGEAQQMFEICHRSPTSDDSRLVAAAFTIKVRHKVGLFTSEDVVKKFEKILLTEVRDTGSRIAVYLFMPDHCHVLLRGEVEHACMLELIRSFRHQGGYWLSKIHCNAEWHVNGDNNSLRREDEIMKHVRYILNNPVRRGIVDDWKQYRYKGSTLYDLDSWS